MEPELDSHFDIIVIGTGFTEAVVAAAAARIGKRVLHLDRNGFYGGQWASFSLTHLQEWAENIKKCSDATPAETSAAALGEGETAITLSSSGSLYFATKYQWHIPEVKEVIGEDADSPTQTSDADTKDENPPEEKSETQIKEKWTKSALEKLNRKFNIDLAPRILFSRGPLVELLISSNVARYLEFKCITRVLAWNEDEGESCEKDEGKLLCVPCSRSDVFTTDVIDLVEKRLLMKFLEFCHSYEQKPEEWKDYAEKPFSEFLASRNLTPRLVHFITSAIGMVDEGVSCTEGLKKTSLFLVSLGRYGSLPFLFPLYGSGEIPQAFCRLCAVFEGIYILRREIDHVVVDKVGNASAISSEGQTFSCKNLLMDVGYSPRAVKENCPRKQSVSRGIFITDKSILEDQKEHVTVLRMPPPSPSKGSPSAITVIEVGTGSAVCPPNSYLVHLICPGEDAESDLQNTAKRLFNLKEEETDKKPNVLFSLYFNQMNLDIDKKSLKNLPPNVYLCGGPDAELDYDKAIIQAKDVFGQIFPGEDFLPRAPDHSDIKFDETEETPNKGDEEPSSRGDEEPPSRGDGEPTGGDEDTENASGNTLKKE